MINSEPWRVGGLPEDWDPVMIPTPEYLRRTASKALDRETAFIVLNQDRPGRIIKRLELIAGVLSAAMGVNGPHQARAIRVGLSLEPRFWAEAQKYDAWQKLIGDMIITALGLHDADLESKVYRVWSIYSYLSWNLPQALKALEKALESANNSGNARLALLVRVEQLNTRLDGMPLAEAKAQALALADEAWHTGALFAAARAYTVLGRAYRNANLSTQTFNYAQQAFALLMQLNMPELADLSLNAMLGALHMRGTGKAAYRARLLAFQEVLVKRSRNPWIAAATTYQHGMLAYHAWRNDEARDYLIRAWGEYRALGDAQQCARAQHMLGLIESRRGHPLMAEHLFHKALVFAECHPPAVWRLQIRHGLAYIAVDQGDHASALEPLLATLAEAEALPPGDDRDALLTALNEDIATVRRFLSAAP